jgi:outer membrane protein assembly factor BamE (lipoprotein component of BamABCDE complex)
MRTPIQLFVLLLLTSCVSKQGQDFSAAGAEQIRVGVSTRGSVEQAMGSPLTRDIKGDNEMWVYSYAATDASGAIAGTSLATAIPFIGPLVSVGVMQNAQTTNESRQVEITFYRGVVKTCNVRLSSGTSTLVNYQGQSTTREIPCGQPIN